MANKERLSFPFDEVYARDLGAPSHCWIDALNLESKFKYPEDDLSDSLFLTVNGEAPRIKRWLKKLPELSHVRYLAIGSRINQVFFDTVCQLSQLQRLSMYWSSVEDIDAISGLPHLTHFHLGSSPRLASLSPLSTLRNLVALSVEGRFKYISNLEPVAELTQLKGLELCGQDYHIQKYDSFEPLSHLTKMQYLSIAAVRVKRGGLAPLRHLNRLEYIHLGLNTLNRWSKKDYQALYENLPNLKVDYIRLAATDGDFQKRFKIK